MIVPEGTILLSPFRAVPDAPCDQPVFIQMPDVNIRFVAVFDSEDKLHASMKHCHVVNYKLKQVDNIDEFVGSIQEYGLRVMLNPTPTSRGTTRWTELFAGNAQFN